jgi:uncharacterized damage-inducible protein DinB
VADLVDEFLYLNSKIEADFERAILDTPEDLRAERWYGTWSVRELMLHLATWDEMDAQYLEAIAAGDDDPARRWSGPEETDSLNAELIEEHATKTFEAVVAYATESCTRLTRAIESLRPLPPERFWERGSPLRGRAMHSATHRTHHLLPILEWHAARAD